MKIVPDPALVEDCIQDLFIEIWNKKENLSDTDSIRKYLIVAIRRKIIKTQKKLRIERLSSDHEENYFQVEIDVETHLTKIEEKSELVQKLKSSFELLSDRQKEALYLKYYGGLNNQEIADVLNINYQSVRNLISRTIKVLARTMKIYLLL